MKSFTHFLLFLFISSTQLFSQADFKVIKVNGTILLRARGISLETGTTFSEKEDLLFRSDDATAAVINSQRGRLVISSKNHNLASASSNFLPSMYNISSRGVALSGNSDLSTHFSGKYVILNRYGIKIDKETYPMDNDHFFFLRYVFKGEEINKKLFYSADTLFIDKATLFTVDGSSIPNPDDTSIKLFYRNGSESVFISEFDLIFPDMDQLAKETEIILDETRGKPVDDIIRETGSYITDFYGKVQADNLAQWLKAKFGINN
ncbi:MAG TPA: hypothetical protein VMV47_08510 [Bacteroidales bacterium]|nr:hypothetical protein [Bacteroidales bacterium]